MFKRIFENVRIQKPLIYQITNYITACDVANMTKACGACPIISYEPLEAMELAEKCDGLNINLGSINEARVESMFIAGRKMNEMLKPVILDPVGVGSSSFRYHTVKKLMEQIHFTVIRGNISEINSIFKDSRSSLGVDADIHEQITEENLNKVIDSLKYYALEYNTILAVTGFIDLVTDGESCYVLRNGNSMMSRITGTGCMLSGLLISFLAANKDKLLDATVAALALMGYAGEIASKKTSDFEGNSSFRHHIIDFISSNESLDFENYIKIEKR